MNVLIVDAFFDESIELALSINLTSRGRGLSRFDVFEEMVRSVLPVLETIPGAASSTEEPTVTVLKATELGAAQLLVDWEHDALSEEARARARRFDMLDYIFIGGDATTAPFDGRLTQLVTLMHMCNQVKKPVFVSGNSAVLGVYVMACRGKKFNILNGPNGVLADLPAFSRYAVVTGASPSAFLDSETGDVYIYAEKAKEWQPLSNIGCRKVARIGPPTSTRFKPAEVQHSIDRHVLSESQKTDHENNKLLIHRELKAYVGSKHVQHFAFKGILKQHFLLTALPDWEINRQWALHGPASREPFTILAESTYSPVVLQYQNALLVATELNEGKGKPAMRQMMKNFLEHMAVRMVASTSCNNRIFSVLEDFLFAGLEGSYDTLRDRHALASPFSTVPVKCTLRHGPTKVDAPLVDMFFPSEVKSTFHQTFVPVNKAHTITNTSMNTTNMMTGNGGGGGGGTTGDLGEGRAASVVVEKKKKKLVLVKNPRDTGSKRLVKMLNKVGRDDQDSIELVQHVADVTSLTDYLSGTLSGDSHILPQNTKDAYTGKIMNQNNIKLRKQGSQAEGGDDGSSVGSLARSSLMSKLQHGEEEEGDDAVIALQQQQHQHHEQQQGMFEGFVNDEQNNNYNFSIATSSLTFFPNAPASEHSSLFVSPRANVNGGGPHTTKMATSPVRTSYDGQSYKHTYESTGSFGVGEGRVPMLEGWSSMMEQQQHANRGGDSSMAHQKTNMMALLSARYLPLSKFHRQSAGQQQQQHHHHQQQHRQFYNSSPFQTNYNQGSMYASVSGGGGGSMSARERISLPTSYEAPKSNFAKLSKTKEMMNESVVSHVVDGQYIGAYKEPYLSSHERQIKEYCQVKKGFIHPQKKTFMLHSGIASTMPLRPEGQVRAHGPFPRKLNNANGFAPMPAECLVMRREEKQKWAVQKGWSSHTIDYTKTFPL